MFKACVMFSYRISTYPRNPSSVVLLVNLKAVFKISAANIVSKHLFSMKTFMELYYTDHC